MMSINVLVVARWYPSHDQPGRGIFVADQVAALAAIGVRLIVISPEATLFQSARDGDLSGAATIMPWVEAIAARPSFAVPRGWGAGGVPIVRIPAPIPTGPGAGREPAEIAELQARALVPIGVALARSWPIDIIHAHTGLPDGVSAAHLAERLGVPLVVTEHESGLLRRLESERARVAYGSLFGPRRRVVAVSAVLARQLTGLLGLAEADVEVIPNAVDVASFQVTGPDARDPNELLWVGSRQASKGMDELLGALRIARSERPDLRLRMIGAARGEGEDDRLRALARELGVADAISLEPPADRIGVAAAMARAAVFVHPSPSETFGVVAVEALASGLPVAAAPSGGVDEILGTGGAFGEVAGSANAAGLADAILRTLARRTGFDPARLRAHAESRYAAPAVAGRILDLYRSLLQDEPVAGAATATMAVRPERGVMSEPRDPGTDLTPVAVRQRLPIVVGLRRPALVDRLRELPSAMRGALSVVTLVAATGTAEDTLLAATVFEADPPADFRAAQVRAGGPYRPRPLLVRIVRRLRHPIRSRTLQELARSRLEMARTSQQDAVRAAMATVPSDVIVEILPMDADDVAIVGPLLGDRVRLAPTTLRGLVDRWDADGDASVPGATGLRP